MWTIRQTTRVDWEYLFILYVPNNKDDMHSGTIKFPNDNRLSKFIGPYVNECFKWKGTI